MKPPSDTELRESLRAAGLSVSAQRLAIARYLFGGADHPTAQQVYDNMLEILGACSRATVYNTLGAFVEAGLIVEVRSSQDDAVRYDPNTEAHHHLRDRKTGRLIDIPYDEIQIANLEALKERFKVDRISITIDGEAR